MVPHEQDKSIDLNKTLSYSQKEGIFGAAMTGLTASFLSPLVIAMGATSTMVAILSSVPNLLGSWGQLGASSLLEFIPDRRKIVVVSSFFQALSWIPILLLPFFSASVPWFIFFVCVHAVLANVYQPVFTSLMGDVVPEDKRGFFFGRRNKYIVLVTFISMLVAGAILSYFGKTDYYGFAIIFGLAIIAQLVSTYYKSHLHAPYHHGKASHFTLWQFLHRGPKTDFGRFVVYAALMKFAVNIANPFFAVYMLSYLKFDYLTFTLILSSSVIFKYLTMDMWGGIIDSQGNRRVIVVTSVLVPFIALFWIFNTNPIYLFCVEALSGFVWAGLDLAISNYIFDAVSPENRIRCSAYYNAIVGKAIFIGASLGGIILAYVPKLWLLEGIPVVLFASFICRALVLFLLPSLKELRLLSVKQGTSLLFDEGVMINPIRRAPVQIISSKPPKVRTGPLTVNPVVVERRVVRPSKHGEEVEKKFVKSMMKGIGSTDQKLRYGPKIDSIFDKLHKGRL